MSSTSRAFHIIARVTARPFGRAFVCAAVLMSAFPAVAQAWSSYTNALYGYSIDVPPGFDSSGENAQGSGAMFYRLEAEQGVSVWAGTHMLGAEGAGAEEADKLSREGWAITEQTLTPEWSFLVAQRDHRILVERLIALCGAQDYAAFRAEFHIRDSISMDEVLAGLSRSLVATGC